LHKSDIKVGDGRLVRFYDRHGNLLGSVLTGGDQARQWTPLSEISPSLVQAFLAAEDKRFFSHGGVDWLALARAFWQNVKARRVVSGGSTITMQLARLLQPKPRNLFNKAREMFTAWRLEAGMSKREILEAYLNRVPMGGNIIGVGAASEVYFGIPPKQVNIAQAAFLAAIPRQPSARDFRHEYSPLEYRQAQILRRLTSLGLGKAKSTWQRQAAQEAKHALRCKINLIPSSSPVEAYHFFFRTIRSAPSTLNRVKVTLDPDIQRMVTAQVRKTVEQLARWKVTNAAAIVLENRTGNVLAYVGSTNWFDQKHQGAVDGVQSFRQPGSALKPFLYAAALENGYTPATVLPDVPVSFPGSEQPWEPQNYSNTFHGAVRLRIALANSLNVPAVRVAQRLGTEKVLTSFRRFGFSLKKPWQQLGLSVVLGGGEVTLFEMARAYMALANEGQLKEPRMTLIADEESGEGDARRVIDPETAWLITNILSDRHARALEFGEESALNLPFPCAVKTGTSSRWRDNWAVGFSSEHTVGVWLGNFDGSPMEEIAAINGAAPLFARIMMSLYQGRPFPGDFARPSGIITRRVCSLSGLPPNPACPHVVEEFFTEAMLEGFAERACSWHTFRCIDRRTGKIASVNCPPEFVEKKRCVRLPEEFIIRRKAEGIL